jgi:hypothetical protein
MPGKFTPFISVHTITDDVELSFYIDKLNYIPLTKKYYYNNIVINNIVDDATTYVLNISMDINKLLYTSELSHLYFHNKYLYNINYISTLPFVTTLNFNFIISHGIYDSINDITTTEFSNDIKEKLNCVLFNDFIIYDVITNNKTLAFISNSLDLSSELAMILTTGSDEYLLTEST